MALVLPPVAPTPGPFLLTAINVVENLGRRNSLPCLRLDNGHSTSATFLVYFEPHLIASTSSQGSECELSQHGGDGRRFVQEAGASVQRFLCGARECNSCCRDRGVGNEGSRAGFAVGWGGL